MGKSWIWMMLAEWLVGIVVIVLAVLAVFGLISITGWLW